ncbi:MAG: ATP-binding cassette domain-containing protein [Blastochloris sp.]|nr:ATP-binding cassette domain-containing protein [Blastochloris sp.]
MGSLALSAHDLAFAWPGQKPLFRDLDLHLPKGGVLAISGPSGCGKSTLGDILLGIRKPIAGSVEWGGVDIVAHPSAIRPLRQRYQKLHQDPVRPSCRISCLAVSSGRWHRSSRPRHRPRPATAPRSPQGEGQPARSSSGRGLGRRSAASGAGPAAPAGPRSHRR